ncbi:MAG: hypothetical protein AB4060_07815 [Crocosphaera sp.]
MSLNLLFRGLGVFTVSVGLGLFTVPMVEARDWNQYSVCVAQLQKFNVSGEDAAIACSNALIPKELSECVSMIGNAVPVLLDEDPEDDVDTTIDGNDHLEQCFQVRRPIDLGNCVADIYNAVPSLAKVDSEADEKINLLTLLNSCRTSSRPGFYSECVIATAREVRDMEPMQAMNICLAEQDFPPSLFPGRNE